MQEKVIISYVGNKGIIRNSEGRILIVKESGTKDWELPGGKMNNDEMGDDLENILSRELSEELGTDFKFRILRLTDKMFRVWAKPRNPNVDKVFLLVWEIEYLGGEIKMQEDEVLDIAWISEEDSQNYEFVNGYKETIERYFKNKGQFQK